MLREESRFQDLQAMLDEAALRLRSLHHLGRFFIFRREPNRAAIPAYAPSRFFNSALTLSMITRNAPVRNLSTGVCVNSGAVPGSS